MLKIRSSIKPSLLKSALMRGTCFASIGILSLLGSIFIPVENLKFLGPLLILGAFLLITMGLFSYQKLKKLERTPHEIIFLEENRFIFAWRGKPTMIIPFKNVKKIFYINFDGQYGTALNINFDDLTLLTPDFDLEAFKKSCQKKYGCDLFFPFFSRYSFEEFKSMLGFCDENLYPVDL